MEHQAYPDPQAYSGQYPHEHQIPPPAPAPPPAPGDYPHIPSAYPPQPGGYFDYGYPGAAPPPPHPLQQHPSYEQPPPETKGRRGSKRRSNGYQPEPYPSGHPVDPYQHPGGYPPEFYHQHPQYHPDTGYPPPHPEEYGFLDYEDGWPPEEGYNQDPEKEEKRRSSKKKSKKKPVAETYDENYLSPNGHGTSPPRAPTPPKAPSDQKKKSKKKGRQSRSPSPNGRNRYGGSIPLAITPPPPTPPPEEVLEASSPHSPSYLENKMRDPAAELEKLKFSPRTSALKHLSRFEKLVDRAFPNASDSFKWDLFAKTIETEYGWSGGRGMTPWKWLLEIEKRPNRNYEDLRIEFLEAWGRSDRQRPQSGAVESAIGGVNLGNPADGQGSLLPMAPEPPRSYDYSDSDREERRKPTTVEVAPGQRNGQIVLTINGKGVSRRGRKDKPVQVVLDTNPNPDDPNQANYYTLPTPKAVEAPPPPEEAMPPLPPPAQIEAAPVTAPSTPPPPEPAPMVVECSPDEPSEKKTSTDLATIAEALLSIPNVEPRPQEAVENGRPRLLEGKIAAITGASRGIGRALALGFAREGAHIVAHYWGTLNDPANDDIVSLCVEVRALGQGCSIVFGDISEPKTADAIVKRAVDTYGRLDIAVNNAGMCWLRDMEDVTPELWLRHLDVNLTGAFYFLQAASKQMKAQYNKNLDSGKHLEDYSILSVSSSAAVNAAMQTHYLPPSAGLQALMRSSAASLGSYGIRCNSLLVGVIRTKMNQDALKDLETRGRVEKRIPLGRIGKPEDVVGPAVMLASEMSRYVTGSEIRVDGGMGAGF